MPPSDDNAGTGYLTSESRPDTIEVPAITLDEHAQETRLTRLDMIKMDIEGAEVSALQGARETICRYRPLVAVEYNRVPCRRAGTSVEELDALLDTLDYDRYTFLGRLQRFRMDTFRQMPDAEAVLNVYCYPRRGGRP